MVARQDGLGYNRQLNSEIKSHMRNVLTLAQALDQRAYLRQQGQTLVFTNGHFDLLHIGHLDYLEKARELGDKLFVGVNGDASTETLKGPGRPIITAQERARLLGALWCVDAVIIFDETTATRVIETLEPDIYVKGSDYRDKPLPERATVERYGGQVVLMDLVPEHSTTALIARIRTIPK
jgi:rfaE bifunctional protein nucleotidyltransferase chain/domain